jgi:hydroxymethylbilane synthase
MTDAKAPPAPRRARPVGKAEGVLKKKIKLGTRASRLALWQADWVKSEIEKRNPDLEVVIERIKTTGDKILDVPLSRVGGKGLFVKEIEESLLDGRVRLAVHSMKDVPTVLPEGLHLAAITAREDARDALISRGGIGFASLPRGAKVGTSSLRRQAQLLSLRPDFEILGLRGNLDTRLRKLDEGLFDAVVLAGAGVKRLGMAERVTEYLDVEVSLPAIGQGALGIETRVDDCYMNNLVGFLNHADTAYAVKAERALLRRLEGGCQVPIAAHGEVSGARLRLAGLVASTDGATVVKDAVSGDRDSAEAMGVDLAERLLRMGAYEILKGLYDVRPPA